MRTNARSFRSHKWVGPDRDLQTSLFDYDLVMVQKPDRDYEDEWFVVYQIGKNLFGTSFIREKELDDLIDGREWANEKDIQSFLRSVDSTKEQWKDVYVVMKLMELISYWGQENILGSDYYPKTIKQLLRLSENLAKKYGEEYRL